LGDEAEGEKTRAGGVEMYMRAGGGYSNFDIPAIEGTFSVHDDSPSNSTYDFSGDFPARSQQIPLALGLGLDYIISDWVRVGGALDGSVSFIDSGILLFSGFGGPVVTIGPGPFRLGAAVNIGFTSYRVNMDIESVGGGDIWMEYDGTQVDFDADGKADMTLFKSGFAVQPEVFIAYQLSDSFGLQARAQYQHSFVDDEPWRITVKETEGEEEATFDYAGKYVPTGSDVPGSMSFTGLVFLLEAQLLFDVK